MENMTYNIDIDIKNMSKIEPLKIAIKLDSLNKSINSIDLITLILNDYFNVFTSDSKLIYKLLLHEAVENNSTITDIFINILCDYYNKRYPHIFQFKGGFED